MSDGNTVTVTTGTTPTNTVYTFNAATGNFTFTNKSTAIANGAAGLTFAKDQGLIPANGTAQGTYTNKSGASVSFDVDSAGKLTIGGKATYLQGSGADQVLTTNNTSSATQATAGDLFAAAGAAAAGDASITLGGKTYTSAGTTTVSFTDTVTKDVLLTKMATAVSGTATDKVQIQLGSGITKANVNIDNTGKITGGTAAIPDELYLDSKGTLTDVKSYNTRYQVDQLTGKVTTIAGGKITGGAQNGQESLAADQVGKQAYLDAKGNLTLEKQSTGDKTTDPLKTLDAAFKVLNKLTGELGAVQNRLESTIANLNNVVNNRRAPARGSRTRTTPRKCRTCPRTRSCNRLVPRFWRKPTKCRKPFCRCCVNHASAGTAGQVRTARSGLPDWHGDLRVPSTKPAQAGFVLSSARATPTTAPDLPQSPDRIPRGTGREKTRLNLHGHTPLPCRVRFPDTCLPRKQVPAAAGLLPAYSIFDRCLRPS